MLKHYDELGGPTTYRTWPPAGPSQATRRSCGRSRLPANYGGTRNGMVVSLAQAHQGNE